MIGSRLWTGLWTRINRIAIRILWGREWADINELVPVRRPPARRAERAIPDQQVYPDRSQAPTYITSYVNALRAEINATDKRDWAGTDVPRGDLTTPRNPSTVRRAWRFVYDPRRHR